ncbi:MAG: Bro-N domain-containing protein [Candidatus Methanoperedens sp.]|nr:Bro-N domain-containing protein [Candidatus Methanoperedens sp.]
MESKDALVVFEGTKIRRTWHDEQWFFSVVDVVGILTDSSIPRRYWSDLKIKLEEEGFELYEKIVQLKLPSSDGKKYETDCSNTESMFRIIQSIPSPKAEPFKRWLAKVGYERVQEIEDPELAQKWMKDIYKLKGYSDEWIEKRVRGVAIRDELTDEWDKRGAKSKQDYSILTADISRATFGLTPTEYKRLKGLKNENLRDHMDDIELILTMLGEATTTRFTRDRDSRKFPELRKDAKEGGDVAGSTRKDIEGKLGKSVVSSDNYLETPEKTKRMEYKNKKKLIE